MNIIFLDVDGVLNSVSNLIKVYGKTHKMQSGYSYPFDYDCLENLRDLVFETNARIVISSSWRKSLKGMKKLFEILKIYELDKFVIGSTPILGLRRGEEIKEYLYSLSDETINFIILDDDNDMGELSQFLVQTNNMIGLTHENVEEALCMFEKSNNKILKKVY